jgi:hypothetical protein
MDFANAGPDKSTEAYQTFSHNGSRMVYKEKIPCHYHSWQESLRMRMVHARGGKYFKEARINLKAA